jgi:hypothetical protein
MAGDIEDYLRDADAPQNRLVAPSRYATQLRELGRRFDPARILVLDLADLAENPEGALAAVFGFLGLPQVELDGDALHPRNAWGSKGRHPGWYSALRRPVLIRLVHRLPSEYLERLRSFVRRRVSKPVDRPELSGETISRLRTLLEPEVAGLREMSGQAFPHWSL